MIVVIGPTALRGEGSSATPDGLAGRIAQAAAADGSSVELVARIGDDRAGDVLLVALARAGVGHVAVLRDPTHPTAYGPQADQPDLEAAIDDQPEDERDAPAWIVAPGDAPGLDVADVGLALRYLTDFRVVVAVHPSPEVAREAASAADWAGAHLVIATTTVDAAPALDVPDGTLVLEVADPADDADPDSAVGARLGRYAAAVDRGDAPATAFAALTAETD